MCTLWDLQFFKTLEKGTFSWIGWKAILGFSPGHTARVFAPLDTALEGQAREGGETKQGDTGYGRGREEVFVFFLFPRENGRTRLVSRHSLQLGKNFLLLHLSFLEAREKQKQGTAGILDVYTFNKI